MLANKLHELTENNPYEQWYRIIIDLIETKIYKPPKPKIKRKPKYRLNLPFSSKAYDFINLPKILRTRSSLDLKPNVIAADKIPMIVYSLNDPIRSLILNYTKFVSSLDVDLAHSNIESIPCSCSEFHSMYMDAHHQHILTGELSIISNLKLSKFLILIKKHLELIFNIS